MFRFYFWTAPVVCCAWFSTITKTDLYFSAHKDEDQYPQTNIPTSRCALLLLQTCSGGLSVYQRLLNHRGWILPAQELHLHLLTNGGQVNGEVTERQALLNRVAVGSWGRVPNHLDEAHKCLNVGITRYFSEIFWWAPYFTFPLCQMVSLPSGSTLSVSTVRYANFLVSPWALISCRAFFPMKSTGW